MNKYDFGKRVREVRKSKDLTSQQVADLVGVNPVFIRHIEAGLRKPSLENFVNLCNALEISPEYLLQDDLDDSIIDSSIL